MIDLKMIEIMPRIPMRYFRAQIILLHCSRSHETLHYSQNYYNLDALRKDALRLNIICVDMLQKLKMYYLQLAVFSFRLLFRGQLQISLQLYCKNHILYCRLGNFLVGKISRLCSHQTHLRRIVFRVISTACIARHSAENY